MGISISRVIRVKFASPFDPNGRPVVDGDETAAMEAGRTAAVAEISVDTNTADWGVVVRFKLPSEGKRKLRDAVAQCRLVDPDGKAISEQIIEGSEVVLEGNGQRGEHTLFLEVSGHVEVFGIETLTESMVEVTGWSASGQM